MTDNLPITSPPQLPADARLGPPAENPFAEAVILIVDDQPANVLLLERMLQRAGYRRLLSTSDPHQGLAMFRAQQPDLMLLDVDMPGLNGFGVMAALNAEYPAEALNVAVVTSHDGEADRRRALQAGVRDFIRKPIELTEVVTRIRNLLQSHQLTRQLRQQNEELAEANTSLAALNHSMSELISIVSHELRTPLTAIKSFAEILRDDGDSLDAESRCRFLDIINEESDRLNRLISDLLDLQKIRAGKMNWRNQRVDLQQSLRDTLEFFAPAYAEQGLTLTLDTTLPTAYTLIDADKLRQLITNLLSNALKFTQHGGVTVSLQRTEQWLDLVILGSDADTTAALATIAQRLGARLHCFDDLEQGQAWLDTNGRRADLLLVGICDAADEAERLSQIRDRYPNLPVALLLDGERPSNQAASKASLAKPIDPDADQGRVELLINDMIDSNPAQPMYEIGIRDSGCGIAAEHLNKVFDRFHQVDSSQTREQRGTGLGLSICQQIVHHYHGKLWVESQPGEGSTFHVLLPEACEEKKKLGEILVEKGLLSADQLSEALKDQV